MAAKRLFDESDHDPDHPEGKRIRTRPSFATVISEVVMVKSLQNFCSALEPLLRRVVNEEMERGLRRSASSLYRSPSLQIQALEASTLQLSFSNKLSLPVFTGSKIEDIDGNPLQILLIDTKDGERTMTTLPYPIKVEIVVLDGDFASGDQDNWNSEEFDRKIVNKRDGKRPLLTGDVIVTVRDGIALIGELVFTDNSSWIRSRNFRLGARVALESCQGVKIREAKTEPFVVKDHRGELYKKHYPPSLDDDVWRLEKIGKDGVFHKKLAEKGINTVQDFLKLWVVEPTKLRRILGLGMSEKMWEATIKHGRTCDMGNKLYVFRGPRYVIVLNPICQVVRAVLNGQTLSVHDLTGIQRAHVELLVRDAYEQWNSLEEIDGIFSENALLPPGEMTTQYLDHPHHHHHQNIIRSNQQCEYQTHGFMVSLPSNAHAEYSDWQQDPTYLSSPIGNGNIYTMSDSSDGDSTPLRGFYNSS